MPQDPPTITKIPRKTRREYRRRNPYPTMENAGMQVRALDDLHNLALDKKSVFCPKTRCLARHQPAAWVISMQGRVILGLIRSGMFVYVPSGSTSS